MEDTIVKIMNEAASGGLAHDSCHTNSRPVSSRSFAVTFKAGINRPGTRRPHSWKDGGKIVSTKLYANAAPTLSPMSVNMVRIRFAR